MARGVPQHHLAVRVGCAQPHGDHAAVQEAHALRGGAPRRQFLLHHAERVRVHRAQLPEPAHGCQRLGRHRLQLHHRRRRQRVRGPRLGADGRARPRLQHAEHRHLHHRHLHQQATEHCRPERPQQPDRVRRVEGQDHSSLQGDRPPSGHGYRVPRHQAVPVGAEPVALDLQPLRSSGLHCASFGTHACTPLKSFSVPRSPLPTLRKFISLLLILPYSSPFLGAAFVSAVIKFLFPILFFSCFVIHDPSLITIIQI